MKIALINHIDSLIKLVDLCYEDANYTRLSDMDRSNLKVLNERLVKMRSEHSAMMYSMKGIDEAFGQVVISHYTTLAQRLAALGVSGSPDPADTPSFRYNTSGSIPPIGWSTNADPAIYITTGPESGSCPRTPK